MKKKRFYVTGAIFRLTQYSSGVYMLTQVGPGIYNLVGLDNGSNRWGENTRVQKRPGISDYILRKLIRHPNYLTTYKYLGQFPEVFERMGQ